MYQFLAGSLTSISKRSFWGFQKNVFAILNASGEVLSSRYTYKYRVAKLSVLPQNNLTAIASTGFDVLKIASLFHFT
ncbi:MAG: hypothetical protein LBI60_05690, partial [Bacteroidales bacterium]|nr:hypothetical protein [Bacteroidales bacterium]